MDEQWKSGGRCNECRRQKYCSKPCKAHKVSVRNALYGLVTSKLDEQTNGMFSEIMNHSYYRK